MARRTARTSPTRWRSDAAVAWRPCAAQRTPRCLSLHARAQAPAHTLSESFDPALEHSHRSQPCRGSRDAITARHASPPKRCVKVLPAGSGRAHGRQGPQRCPHRHRDGPVSSPGQRHLLAPRRVHRRRHRPRHDGPIVGPPRPRRVVRPPGVRLPPGDDVVANGSVAAGPVHRVPGPVVRGPAPPHRVVRRALPRPFRPGARKLHPVVSAVGREPVKAVAWPRATVAAAGGGRVLGESLRGDRRESMPGCVPRLGHRKDARRLALAGDAARRDRYNPGSSERRGL